MKKSIALLLLGVLLFVQQASSQYIWLQPQQYQFSRAEEANIRFRIGNNIQTNNWKGNRQTVQDLDFCYADIIDDISDGLCNDEGDSLQFSIHEESTATITLNNKPSLLELDTTAFFDFLKKEELLDEFSNKNTHGLNDSTVSIACYQSAKTVLQFGAAKTDVVKKTINNTISIIPLNHPYQIKNGDSISVQVLFKGEPLQNARISIYHKLPSGTTTRIYTSNLKGEIQFPISTVGEWLIGSTLILKTDTHLKEQWQIYFSSITWGYSGKNIITNTSR